MRPSMILRILCFSTAPIWCTEAFSQKTCIQDYFAGRLPTLGFAPSEIEAIVGKVAKSVGLSAVGITVIPCDGIIKVQATYTSDEVPQGDYILYDPIWVREVLGPNLKENMKDEHYQQAVFLFAHELGHLFGRHFTANLKMTDIQKETSADEFAGCAAKALGMSWKNIEDFLGRIRGETDTNYPSRTTAIKAARASFDRCNQITSASTKTDKEHEDRRANYNELNQSPGGVSELMYLPNNYGTRPCKTNFELFVKNGQYIKKINDNDVLRHGDLVIGILRRDVKNDLESAKISITSSSGPDVTYSESRDYEGYNSGFWPNGTKIDCYLAKNNFKIAAVSSNKFEVDVPNNLKQGTYFIEVQDGTSHTVVPIQIRSTH